MERFKKRKITKVSKPEVQTKQHKKYRVAQAQLQQDENSNSSDSDDTGSEEETKSSFNGSSSQSENECHSSNQSEVSKSDNCESCDSSTDEDLPNPVRKQTKEVGVSFKSVFNTAMRLHWILTKLWSSSSEDDPRIKSELNLRSYQIHGVQWLLKMEKFFPHGGILADDMG